MKVMQGTVQSAKTAKTAIVTVVRRWQHPLYKKYVKRTKNYACHVEGIELKEGDKVEITECRPMSKTKRFIVTTKLSESATIQIVDEIVPAKKAAKEVKAVKEVKKDKKAK